MNTNTGRDSEIEVYLWKQAILEIALFHGGNKPAMEDLILGYLDISPKCYLQTSEEPLADHVNSVTKQILYLIKYDKELQND